MGDNNFIDLTTGSDNGDVIDLTEDDDIDIIYKEIKNASNIPHTKDNSTSNKQTYFHDRTRLLKILLDQDEDVLIMNTTPEQVKENELDTSTNNDKIVPSNINHQNTFFHSILSSDLNEEKSTLNCEIKISVENNSITKLNLEKKEFNLNQHEEGIRNINKIALLSFPNENEYFSKSTKVNLNEKNNGLNIMENSDFSTTNQQIDNLRPCTSVNKEDKTNIQKKENSDDFDGYKCMICSLYYLKQPLIYRHYIDIHELTPTFYEDCTFVTLSSLELEFQIHVEECHQKCYECKEYFSTSILLKEHKQKIHEKSDVKNIFSTISVEESTLLNTTHRNDSEAEAQNEENGEKSFLKGVVRTNSRKSLSLNSDESNIVTDSNNGNNSSPEEKQDKNDREKSYKEECPVCHKLITNWYVKEHIMRRHRKTMRLVARKSTGGIVGKYRNKFL